MLLKWWAVRSQNRIDQSLLHPLRKRHWIILRIISLETLLFLRAHSTWNLVFGLRSGENAVTRIGKSAMKSCDRHSYLLIAESENWKGLSAAMNRSCIAPICNASSTARVVADSMELTANANAGLLSRREWPCGRGPSYACHNDQKRPPQHIVMYRKSINSTFLAPQPVRDCFIF